MPTELEQFRYFLKDSVRQSVNFAGTDQNRGVPPPPMQKPHAPDAELVTLPGRESFDGLAAIGLLAAIERRRSHRAFSDAALSLAELASLLWATQGVREMLGDWAALRTVPSAGARHSFETYLSVHRVEGLEPGVYRYLPLDHKLVLEHKLPDLTRRLTAACLGQRFAGGAAVTFIWSTIPYRMEWRYGLAAHRVIAIDAGHVCQNLYLACEGIGAGACAIGAYDQEAVDAFINVDGRDEFAVYLAAVGKLNAEEQTP